MTKLAFIGAGSFGFTRSLVKDILTFPALADATIALMDIDPNRLADIAKAVDRIVAEGDSRKVFHAICFDPLTSAVLRLEEIKRMVDEMMAQNRPCLPQFTTVD
jgi:alpha-galactosidase/6-phospho-beta-glucosidase family protein